MLLAQLETAVSVVDKASAAGDRWLFLAALVVIIVGGTACIRWLVNSIETKDKAHAAATALLTAQHTAERAEWRTQQAEAKAGFLDALREQRVDFRAELALERAATAQMAKTVENLARQLVPLPAAE